MSLLEVLSSRVAAPMVSKDLNMGIRYFPLIYFRSIFIFKVPRVEHGSNACPMVVLFHIGEVQTESFACSIIDGGGNQFAGAYSILVC